jgi:hypothetical protein
LREVETTDDVNTLYVLRYWLSEPDIPFFSFRYRHQAGKFAYGTGMAARRIFRCTLDSKQSQPRAQAIRAAAALSLVG